MTASMLNYLMPVAGVAVAASVLAMAPIAAPQDDDMTTQTAREQIGAIYQQWGRARVSYDEEFIEATLAPDFYVLIDGERMSREEFIAAIVRKRPTSRLTRFDADVLTVQRAEDGWTVVITEKIEVEVTGAEGATRTAYSFWVTRDGFRKDGDRWTVTYSEAIGYERWPAGAKPPFEDW